MTTFACRDCSWLRALLLGLCVVATTDASTAAQRQSATLEGTVQDASGAVVGGAAVTVREADTGLTRTTRTDSLGSFRLADLPIGTYDVHLESQGFDPYAHAGIIGQDRPFAHGPRRGRWIHCREPERRRARCLQFE